MPEGDKGAVLVDSSNPKPRSAKVPLRLIEQGAIDKPTEAVRVLVVWQRKDPFEVLAVSSRCRETDSQNKEAPGGEQLQPVGGEALQQLSGGWWWLLPAGGGPGGRARVPVH